MQRQVTGGACSPVAGSPGRGSQWPREVLPRDAWEKRSQKAHPLYPGLPAPGKHSDKLSFSEFIQKGCGRNGDKEAQGGCLGVGAGAEHHPSRGP